MPKPATKKSSRVNGHPESRHSSDKQPTDIDQLGLMRMTAMIQNSVLTSRAEWVRTLNPDRRDIDKECGYQTHLSIRDYRQMYDREGVAQRVVQLLPRECWAMDPQVYEVESVTTKTRFERAWQKLLVDLNVLHYLEKIDILSGIGEYGVLLLGFDDSGSLESPVTNFDRFGRTQPSSVDRQLLYLRCFDESVVLIDEYEEDENNVRYGCPKFYNIEIRESVSRRVHWTRTLHVADTSEPSEICAAPRQRPVWNRLHDLRKILGGASEGLYKGGFPGYSFEVDPEVEFGETEQAAFKDEIFRYFEGLQRAIATQGVKAKSLSTQVADPSKHIEANLQNIALTMGVPYPVFIGSEDSKLTSQQSAKTWNKRLTRRQSRYLTPMLLRPFVQRLIDVGVLPNPSKGFQVSWPDLNAPSGHEKAQVTKLLVDALARYMQFQVYRLFPPIEFLTRIVGLEVEEAELVLEDAVDLLAEDEKARKLAEDQARLEMSQSTGEDGVNRFREKPGRTSDSLNQTDTDANEVSTVEGN